MDIETESITHLADNFEEFISGLSPIGGEDEDDEE
jgi:hypothetical protein